jgi:hypothetical protein
VAQAVTGVTLDGSDDVDDDACRAGVDHLAGGKGKSASRTAPRQPAKGANGPKAKRASASDMAASPKRAFRERDGL